MMFQLQVARREYRGQRTTDAIVAFVEEQLKDPVQAITDLNQLMLQVSS